jgi:hypothetical protein
MSSRLSGIWPKRVRIAARRCEKSCYTRSSTGASGFLKDRRGWLAEITQHWWFPRQPVPDRALLGQTTAVSKPCRLKRSGHARNPPARAIGVPRGYPPATKEPMNYRSVASRPCPPRGGGRASPRLPAPVEPVQQPHLTPRARGHVRAERAHPRLPAQGRQASRGLPASMAPCRPRARQRAHAPPDLRVCERVRGRARRGAPGPTNKDLDERVLSSIGFDKAEGRIEADAEHSVVEEVRRLYRRHLDHSTEDIRAMLDRAPRGRWHLACARAAACTSCPRGSPRPSTPCARWFEAAGGNTTFRLPGARHAGRSGHHARHRQPQPRR